VSVTLVVNGQRRTVEAESDCPLLFVLHDELGLNNPRFGCGLGQCGACTVIVDGRAVRSCTLPVSRVSGKEVTTLEGLGAPGRPDPIQAACIDEQAFQCGYCLNGWILTARALLDRRPHPSEIELRQALDPLICRCGSHPRIFAAVRRAAGARQDP